MSRSKQRGDASDVIIVVFLIIIILLIAVSIAVYSDMRQKCKQYDDTKITEVPAKCINPRGGTY